MSKRGAGRIWLNEMSRLRMTMRRSMIATLEK
jgi:hypothetical protein